MAASWASHPPWNARSVGLDAVRCGAGPRADRPWCRGKGRAIINGRSPSRSMNLPQWPRGAAPSAHLPPESDGGTPTAHAELLATLPDRRVRSMPSVVARSALLPRASMRWPRGVGSGGRGRHAAARRSRPRVFPFRVYHPGRPAHVTGLLADRRFFGCEASGDRALPIPSCCREPSMSRRGVSQPDVPSASWACPAVAVAMVFPLPDHRSRRRVVPPS